MIDSKYHSDKQFGFLKGRSTLEHWTDELEKGGRIDVVYTGDRVCYIAVLCVLH